MFKNPKIIKVKLSKNLLRSIKKGEPWLYADALDAPKESQACLCKIEFKKNIIAWGFFDPNSPLRVRVLSTDPQWSFSKSESSLIDLLKQKLQQFNSDRNNSFRAVNGEGDFFPGLICDKYDEVAVLQADGEGPYQIYDWDKIAELCKHHLETPHVFYKARNQHQVPSKFLLGSVDNPSQFLENEMKFELNFKEGQKTGFFIDQRENRQYVSTISKAKKVLNLFSYTGGFSVAAGKGGARHVTSVDISAPAIASSKLNWSANELPEPVHEAVCDNVFDFLSSKTEAKAKYDIVICDPPSFSHSEKDKAKAVNAYLEIFSGAAGLVNPVGGDLLLSSCSSHISYDDFYEIAENVLSLVKRKGKLSHIGHQAACHSYPLSFRKMQYLKFLHIKIYK